MAKIMPAFIACAPSAQASLYTLEQKAKAKAEKRTITLEEIRKDIQENHPEMIDGPSVDQVLGKHPTAPAPTADVEPEAEGPSDEEIAAFNEYQDACMMLIYKIIPVEPNMKDSVIKVSGVNVMDFDSFAISKGYKR